MAGEGFKQTLFNRPFHSPDKSLHVEDIQLNCQHVQLGLSKLIPLERRPRPAGGSALGVSTKAALNSLKE